MSRDLRYHGWAALTLDEQVLDYASDYETVDSWKHDRFNNKMFYICQIIMYNQECIHEEEKEYGSM